MATLETQHVDEVIAGSRRRLLTLGGAALAGLALTSLADAQSTTLTDSDYLNFALNLEYLEAEYYTLAVSGTTIDQMGVGITSTSSTGTTIAGGSVITKAGGPSACKVTFKNSAVMGYATEIAAEERNHVSFLRSVLGAKVAVQQPQIDLYNSFNTLAGLLGITGLTAFDPFADDASFLLGSYIFEDVGVTAYTGAAPALTVNANLDSAAGIQAVESYHAGLVRTTIFGLDQNPNTLGALGTVPAGTLSAVTTAISKLRASVDGTNNDDIGLGMISAPQQVMLNGTSNVTASSIVDASTTGSNFPAATGATTSGSLVFSRSASQVLSIVYAGGSGKGGFFPAGLNGNVK